MRILQIIGTLNPNSGGPVEILVNLATSLQQQGNNVEIVTLDRKDAIFDNSQRLTIYQLGQFNGNFKFSMHLLPWLVNNKNRFDIIIVHGIWQYQGLAALLLNRKLKIPYITFVHGALDPWFKHAYPLKQIKKVLYWSLIECHVLRHSSGVVYNTEEEKNKAAKSFWLYKAHDIVFSLGIKDNARDLLDEKLYFIEKFHLSGKHILLFLGRIHPVKGCDLINPFIF